ncbi:DJ-1/PfpI family protein [Chitinophaga sancti]|uniref:DJ-1/PfpI family protein n=2 Tax=Chitinophaga sancti TaxID=1004 RepID=A0ABZ0XIW1_9BACT|nr:DJ-1/PfpI family protein [Chitinophaga sancti]WQD63782.1 DJ-1/PfpI family protein [Chitinophaga sancti]WQG90593.1 DJ-1/PfpI family protein [Chitinophaga sancti]
MMRILLLICLLFTGVNVLSAQTPVVKVAVLLYPGMALQDFAGPADVFTKAREITRGEYQVYTASCKPGTVYTEGHIGIQPDYSIRQLPKPDILILPGASFAVIDSLRHDSTLLSMIRQYQDSVSVLLSVGTGTWLLAAAGLLDHQQATTHYFVADDFASTFPAITLVKDVRYVDNGNILTSAGVTAGIDGALHLVARYSGDRIAGMVARAMQYTPKREEPWPMAPTGMDYKKDADVICGMIAIDKNIFVEYQGKRYYFCSEVCKKAFLHNTAQ